jgi:hypothetical protein
LARLKNRTATVSFLHWDLTNDNPAKQLLVSGSERALHEETVCTLENRYRRNSISGTTFSGKKFLSGAIFHAI